MKNLILVCLLFAMPLVYANGPKKVEIQIQKVYAPEGFDSNDHVEIMVSASLPSLCYKSPHVGAIKEGQLIKLKMFAYFYEQECVEVKVPVLEKLEMGILDQGEYKITTNGLGDQALKVKESTSSAIDDNIYANVEYIEQNDSNRVIKLVGENPSCLSLKEIKYSTNHHDTVAILPIMEQTSADCSDSMKKFEFEFEVPENLPAKALLLHVRAMNGKSVNTLFQNKI
jgi:hypothetical protein